MTNLPKIIAGESFGISVGSQTDLSKWNVKITLFTSGTSKFAGSYPASPYDDFSIIKNAASLAVNVSSMLSALMNYDILTMRIALTDTTTGATKIANAHIAQIISPRAIRDEVCNEINPEIVFVDNDISLTLALADRIGIDGQKGEKGEQGDAAPYTLIEYSADGKSWHPECANNDAYMRQSTDNGTTWSAAIAFKQDISGKADKDGYAPQARVGFADALVAPEKTVTQTNAYIGERRTSGDGLSIQSSMAQLNSVGGQLIKQYIRNGNFADGFDGWTTSGTKTDNGDYVTIVSNGSNHFGQSGKPYFVAGHKYVMLALLNSTKGILPSIGGAGSFYNQKFTTPNKWSWGGTMKTMSATDTSTQYLYGSGSTSATIKIPKEVGVMCFDLTELGLDTQLTTLQQCIDYFGTKYIAEGISASQPNAIISTGFNQFDKNAMVLSGKTINATTGAIENGSNYVIYVPCVRGISGGNNGYRVADITGANNVVRVGYNPFAPTSGCFDAVYDMVAGSSGKADIIPSQAGYVIAEVKSLDNLCVHLKWSYTDFTAQYSNIEYRKDTLTLPSTAPLCGLRHLTSSSRALRSDSVNLADNLKQTYVVKVSFDGTEPWEDSTVTSDGFMFRYWQVASFANALKGISRFYALSNHYTAFVGGWADLQDKMYQLYPANNVIAFRDSAYTTVDAWKQHLADLATAGTPLTVYAALEEPKEEPMANDLNNVYRVDDFGTEATEGNSTYPASLSITYIESLTDKLRNLPDGNTLTEQYNSLLARLIALESASTQNSLS